MSPRGTLALKGAKRSVSRRVSVDIISMSHQLIVKSCAHNLSSATACGKVQHSLLSTKRSSGSSPCSSATIGWGTRRRRPTSSPLRAGHRTEQALGSVCECAPGRVTGAHLKASTEALDSEWMLGELVDALWAALQVATTDPGPDTTRQR